MRTPTPGPLLAARPFRIALIAPANLQWAVSPEVPTAFETPAPVAAVSFFHHCGASLKWQPLGPYEKFAAMIDRHRDGIAAYCRPENKIALGFVESLNNKIRVIQRRAYGLRDEDYLRLKILTSMLPPLKTSRFTHSKTR